MSVDFTGLFQYQFSANCRYFSFFVTNMAHTWVVVSAVSRFAFWHRAVIPFHLRLLLLCHVWLQHLTSVGCVHAPGRVRGSPDKQLDGPGSRSHQSAPRSIRGLRQASRPNVYCEGCVKTESLMASSWRDHQMSTKQY